MAVLGGEYPIRYRYVNFALASQAGYGWTTAPVPRARAKGDILAAHGAGVENKLSIGKLNHRAEVTSK
jgi:hypothetical protein